METKVFFDVTNSCIKFISYIILFLSHNSLGLGFFVFFSDNSHLLFSFTPYLKKKFSFKIYKYIYILNAMFFSSLFQGYENKVPNQSQG